MSFHDFAIQGSLSDHKPLRPCGQCRTDASQAGGLQVTPTKWICGGCWLQRIRTNNGYMRGKRS